MTSFARTRCCLVALGWCAAVAAASCNKAASINEGDGAGGSTSTGGVAGAAGRAGAAGASGGSAGAGSGGATATGGATPAGGAGGGTGGAAGRGAGGGLSGGAGGAAGAAASGSLTLSGLAITANPRMSLSCYVSWTTSAAANSEVQFGVGGYQFRIVDDTPVTSHKVHVVGMHATTAYQIKAVSTNATGTGSATGTFTTGSLPAGLPAATLLVNTTAKAQPGWTLTNIFNGGSSPAIIVIVDQAGLPVWYFVDGKTNDQFGMTSTDFLANSFLPASHVLIGNASAEPAREVDLEANILWEGPTGGTPACSHHTGKLMNGDYAVVRESNASARVEVLDPTMSNKVVWSWDLYQHGIKPKTTAADWCHLNSVTFDEANDFLYFNCRFQGLFKVNRADGSILWQMGAGIDDSNAGDVKYLPDNTARFNDSHDPEVHGDGTFLFYDNQGWSSHTGGEMNGSYHTRVVEYLLDEPSKTATLTWQFPGSFSVDSWYTQSWSTPIWGDADRLANGDVLVTAGVKSGTVHTRIFEVTRAGEVVWAIEWPTNIGSYRADRISPPPVQALP